MMNLRWQLTLGIPKLSSKALYSPVYSSLHHKYPDVTCAVLCFKICAALETIFDQPDALYEAGVPRSTGPRPTEMKQVSAVAKSPARQNRAVDGAWQYLR